jgi:hypothetical protein
MCPPTATPNPADRDSKEPVDKTGTGMPALIEAIADLDAEAPISMPLAEDVQTPWQAAEFVFESLGYPDSPLWNKIKEGFTESTMPEAKDLDGVGEEQLASSSNGMRELGARLVDGDQAVGYKEILGQFRQLREETSLEPEKVKTLLSILGFEYQKDDESVVLKINRGRLLRLATFATNRYYGSIYSLILEREDLRTQSRDAVRGQAFFSNLYNYTHPCPDTFITNLEDIYHFFERLDASGDGRIHFSSN